MTDKIELVDNGEMKITIDAITYECRRPKAGEYKEFNAMAIHLGESDQPALSKIITDLTESEEELTPEQLKQYNDAREALSDSSLTAAQGWFHKVLSTLSKQEFTVAAEDLPPWVAQQSNINAMLGHWISVPLVAPGS